MLPIFAVVCLEVLVAAQSSHMDEIWPSYKLMYGKSYGPLENVFRRDIFKLTVLQIQQHNLQADMGFSTYWQGLTPFTDMTNKEFRAAMNGFRGNSALRTAPLHQLGGVELPKQVDWRKKGYVTPIKNQGICASSWAFSATGSLEGQHFAKYGTLVSLSEQNLVDCSDGEGNMGCLYGNMNQAFQYVMDNMGIDNDTCYPYKAQDQPCTFKSSCIGSGEISYTDVTSQSGEALQQAIAEVGPISAAIDSSHPSFQNYKSGVYDEPACSTMSVDHGVLVVGYDSDAGDEYYIVKNSWGTDWGMKGYIWMSRNKDNQCGIASVASYPVV